MHTTSLGFQTVILTLYSLSYPDFRSTFLSPYKKDDHLTLTNGYWMFAKCQLLSKPWFISNKELILQTFLYAVFNMCPQFSNLSLSLRKCVSHLLSSWFLTFLVSLPYKSLGDFFSLVIPSFLPHLLRLRCLLLLILSLLLRNFIKCNYLLYLPKKMSNKWRF